MFQQLTIAGGILEALLAANFLLDARNFAVIHIKFKPKEAKPEVFFGQKHANGKANSEDPDQTAPLGVCTVCRDLVQKLKFIMVN